MISSRAPPGRTGPLAGRPGGVRLGVLAFAYIRAEIAPATDDLNPAVTAACVASNPASVAECVVVSEGRGICLREASHRVLPRFVPSDSVGAASAQPCKPACLSVCVVVGERRGIWLREAGNDNYDLPVNGELRSYPDSEPDCNNTKSRLTELTI